MSPALPAAVPDRSRLVGLPGARVFVTDVGVARPGTRPLVLLHDLLQCGYAFDAVVQGLAGERRVLVIDLPGAGESDRPEPEAADGYAPQWLAARVADTLALLGIGAIDLLGAGFGAAVAIAFAAAHGDAVGRLVAIAPPHSGMQLAHELRLARLPKLGELAFEHAYRRSDLRRTLASWYSSPELVSELAVDVYWDRLGRQGGLAAARAMLLQTSELGGLANLADQLATPTLLLWGDGDRAVSFADCERWQAIFTNVEALVIEGCGHAVAEERPDRVIAQVVEFLGAGAGTVHG
jgi:pimeloyl-ACP methyl ester carboxylesterase